MPWRSIRIFASISASAPSLLDSEKSNRRSHNPFRNFENIWATLEVFNLIDRDNTISYMLIKDFSNTVFAMPNRLTPQIDQPETDRTFLIRNLKESTVSNGNSNAGIGFSKGHP